MSQAEDAPDVAAEIAAARRTIVRQSIMAVAGLIAVSAFLVFKPGDVEGTKASLIAILPWLVGISAVMLAANRWTFALRAKAIRNGAGEPRLPAH